MRDSLALCLVFLFAAPLYAQTDTALKSASKARSEAQKSGDVQTWAKYTTDDLVEIQVDGRTVTKQQRAAIIASPAQRLPGPAFTGGDRQWRVYDGSAVETFRLEWPGFKPVLVTRLWVKTRETWKVASEKWASIQPVPDTGAKTRTSNIGRAELVSVDAVVVDSFDSVSQWSTNPANGVEITVHSDSGRHGRGMRVDFDFRGHPGYGIVHRNVDLELPPNYEFSFAVRGDAPTNTLEFKLVDATYANVWWSNNPDFIFSREWRTIGRKKRQICFAWGPGRGGDIHHVAAIEFAITAGSGGKGSVWIDDLSLTPLDPDSPFDLTAPIAAVPIVGTWESAATTDGGVGAKLDFAADGTFISTLGVVGIFTYTIGDNQLTTTVKNPATGRSEDHTTAIRIERDTLTQKDGNGPGKDVTMKRVRRARDTADPILGSWSFSHETGATAFVAFSKNGQGLFRLPISSCSGTWTDAGGRHLSVSINGQVPTAWDYSIENGVLSMRVGQGREVKYNRVTGPE
jgi:Domain of unknown function (DUF4440)